MVQDIVVKVNSVKKSFRLPTENTNSLKRTIVNYFKGIKGYREQHVLRDISFSVNRGDFLGIVGRNGSGKSTLLKIISQIYSPDSGSVEVNGKLVSFIELGVGFNPELTGKENVYLNGALIGFSPKEIDGMYEDIVDFAELHDFMGQKLKNYSSGMQVRLAFSVAIRAKSDILVLDEVLAVGDEAFQRKCNDYFMQSKEEQKTIILVTHSMEAVRKYCNKALLIDKGKIKIYGTPDEVANQYSLDNVFQEGASTVIENNEIAESKEKEEITKEELSLISNFKVSLISDELVESSNKVIEFDVEYEVQDNIETYIAFSLTDIDRNFWMYNDNSFDNMTDGLGKKKYRYRCSLDNINQCKLQLIVSVRNSKHEPLAIASGIHAPIIIISPKPNMKQSESDSSTGVITRNGSWLNNYQ